MRSKTRPWLHGGVVTQRIANPQMALENIEFFLQNIAEKGVNRWRTCKTLFRNRTIFSRLFSARFCAGFSAGFAP